MLKIGEGITGNNMLTIGEGGFSSPSAAGNVNFDGVITHEDTDEVAFSDSAEITIEDRL
jgi:hypothetical protein